MATTRASRTTKKTAEKAADTGAGELSLGAVKASTGVKHTKSQSDNPTLDYVRQSLANNEPYAFNQPTAEAAKQVVNMLRRAAITIKGEGEPCSLSLSVTPMDDGTFDVDFHARAKERTRSYNVEEVRTWVKAAHNVEFEGRVPEEYRAAFRTWYKENGRDGLDNFLNQYAHSQS